VGKRVILWAAGAAAAVAALVALPGLRDWLMRVTGRRTDRRHYETEGPEAFDDIAADDAAGEADELRLSLRARLAESGSAQDVDEVVAANAGAAEAEATDGSPSDTVDEARARVRAKAREARKRLTETPEADS
jgi:hypothetical protein